MRTTVAIGVLFISVAQAQSNEKSLTFDAASVKPSTIPVGGRGPGPIGDGLGRGGNTNAGGPGTNTPDRIRYQRATLKTLLAAAYDVKEFQISGPGFLSTERFDVQATMASDTTREQFRVMLQNLLAERFKVAVHRETKELPMYAMVVAKNGPKLKETMESSKSDEVADPVDDGPPRDPPGGRGQFKMGADGFPVLPMPGGGRAGLFVMMMPNAARLMAQKQTMENLADRLSSLLPRPVKDETRLKSQYDFTLTCSTDGLNTTGMGGPGGPGREGGGREGAGRGPAENPDTEPPANIFAAIQAQLGLKLEARKGRVELIYVDHAEKSPTEN